MVLKSEIIDGNKYMWDGNTYATEEEAKTAMKGYESDKFETRLVTEGGRIEIYTRRHVTEIVLEREVPV